MSNARLESLAWVCIFGGLLLASLGLFIPAAQTLLRGGLLVAGGGAVVLGIVLVWVRSRRP